MDVPSARVHHWRGVIFVPGVTLDDLLAELRRNAPPAGQEDVLASRVLERGPDRMKVYLRLQRRKIVTVVYDTEHVVTFNTYGPARASTVSVATKIAELENPGTPDERERPQGEDRGFLWKLNAYWRYEQVAGGVIAECESIEPEPRRACRGALCGGAAHREHRPGVDGPHAGVVPCAVRGESAELTLGQKPDTPRARWRAPSRRTPAPRAPQRQ